MTFVRWFTSALAVSSLCACGLDAGGEAFGDAAVDAARVGTDAGKLDAPRGKPDARGADAAASADGSADHVVPQDHATLDAPGASDGPALPDATDATDATDAPHGVDAPPDAPAVCPAVPDCSNTACQAEGFHCIAAPSSWAPAAVDFMADSACPPGYDASADLSTAPAPPSTSCECTCGVTGTPTCTTGTVNVAIGSGGMCTGNVSWDANKGACTDTSASFAADVKVTMTPPLSGATCSGTPSLPPVGSTKVNVCTVDPSQSGTGCSAGSICVAPTSRTACAIHQGAAACPSAYPTAHAVGTGVSDNRTCAGPCGCGPLAGSCDDKTWTFFTQTGCMGSTRSVDMDGQCDATGAPAANAYASYRYSATPNAQCGGATMLPMVTGMATLSGPVNLCCTE